MSSPIAAASVLVARHPGSDEVYLVSRAPSLRFMGGFVAFPGGKLHPDDDALADPAGSLTSRHVAAIRELFEETGILLAHHADGSFPTTGEGLVQGRHDLLAETVAFGDWLRAMGLHLQADDLLPAGHLVTPPFAAIRFDTAFFVAHMPPGQDPEVWPGELTDGRWARVSKTLEEWRQGEVLLSPPTHTLLNALQGHPLEELPQRLRPVLEELERTQMPPIWFGPGVRMVPLDCKGLPPTTHTNAYILGTGPVYLLDPGPTDPAEQAKLFAILDGHRLDAVVLTHHHPDHIGAATACAERYRVPIVAHPITAELLAGRIVVNRLLRDGDRLDLGEAPHGRGRWSLRALHTPGHAPGHLAFHEEDYRLLLAGDMVSTLSSMIILPDDGDLSLYLDSLRRLIELPLRLLLPAHGPPTMRAEHTLNEALRHRLFREEQLIHCLGGAPRTVPELAMELYRGYPEAVIRLGELQILAGLMKLKREHRVDEEEGRWWLRS